MRRALFILSFVAFFIALAMPIMAAPVLIDAQSSTVCDLMTCITTVDMSKYISGAILSTAKTVDLASAISAIKSNNVTGMVYAWSGNNLTITGSIKPGTSNYWLLPIGTAATIDPWWNSSYPYCKNITMVDTAVKAADYTFLFNITNFTGMNADASDIRFINNTCNGADNDIELPHWDWRIINNSLDEAYVKLQNTTRNISIYYGNPTATDTSDITTAGLFGDNFNRADGAVSNGWTVYNSCGSIETNRLKITGTTWFCGIDRIITGQSSNEGQEHVFSWWENAIGNDGIRWDIGGKVSQYTGGVPMATFMFHSTGGSGFQYYNASTFTFLVSASTSTWYSLRAQVNKSISKSRIFINGTSYTIIGANQPFTTFNASFGAADAGATTYLDNFFARKYNNNESSISYTIGALQINTVGSPLWSNPLNTTPGSYSPSSATVFNITWANGSSSSMVNMSAVNLTLYSSGTNVYNMSCIGTTSLANCSYSIVLGAGNFTWKSDAKSNDTSPATNATSNFTFNISAATPSCSLSFASPITYNATHTPICSCSNTDSGGSVKLYRNATDVSAANNTAILLGVGAYNYTCNSSATSNYTVGTSSSILTIVAGVPSLAITFAPSSTVVTGTLVNASCSKSTSEVSTTLYNTTTAISNPQINIPTATLLGGYGYVCNSSATANYTAGTTGSTLTVTSSSGLSVNVYNEENTSAGLVFNITINNGTTSSTATNQSNPYTNNSITGYITIDVSSSGYASRTFYASILAGNTTTVNAYLEPAASSTPVLFYTYAYTEQTLPNVLINVERLYALNYITVAQKITDAAGSANIYLNPAVTYRINASLAGYSTVSITIAPSASPYVIYLSGTSFNISYNTMFKNIVMQVEPKDAALVVNSSYPFFYYLNSSDTSLSWFGWKMAISNGTIVFNTNTSNAVGGNQTYTLNTSGWIGNETISLLYWFKKNDTTPLFNATNLYYVYDVEYANTSIMAMAVDLKAQAGSQVSASQFAFISVLLSIIFMAAASSQMKMFGSGIFGIGCLAFFTVLGTFIYGAAFLIGWDMLAILAVGVVAAIMVRGGFG